MEDGRSQPSSLLNPSPDRLCSDGRSSSTKSPTSISGSSMMTGNENSASEGLGRSDLIHPRNLLSMT